MTDILRPVLEFSVIIPGILLAYLPVKNYLSAYYLHNNAVCPFAYLTCKLLCTVSAVFKNSYLYKLPCLKCVRKLFYKFVRNCILPYLKDSVVVMLLSLALCLLVISIYFSPFLLSHKEIPYRKYSA